MLESALGGEADRAAHPRAAQAAVPVGVPGQVLLVVVLGVVERAGLPDLGGDLTVAGLGQALLVGVAGRLGCLLLDVGPGSVPERIAGVDGRAVLGADVVA